MSDLTALVTRIWDMLDDAVARPTAPFRTPALATVGDDGGAEVRTVVLRAADRAAGRVIFFTDARAAKLAQIGAEPRVSLAFWDAGASLQARLRARASRITGAEADRLWSGVGAHGQALYGASPSPGEAIDDADAFTHKAQDARADFAAVACDIDQIEVLHLDRPHHRRALYRREDGWQGGWRVP